MASTPPTGSNQKKLFGPIKQSYKKFKNSILPPSNVGGSTNASSSVGLLSPGLPPTPSPSTPIQPSVTPQSQLNPLPGVTPSTSDKSSFPHELKQISDCVLSSALHALKLSTQTFPPLKPVIEDLLDCLDVIRAATGSNQEYRKLTTELTAMVNDMKPYVDKLSLEDRNGSATRIMKDIEKEVAYIKQLQERSKIRDLMDSQQSGNNVIECYQRVETLFRRLQTDISFRVWDSSEKLLWMTLLQGMSPAHDALYNSGFSTTIRRRGCTKRTREQVQSEIHSWIGDPNGAKIYWLNGMAGTGKTTIAYSLCEWLQKNQQLGGSYFCSRASNSCSDVNSIIPTIAYQLAQYSPTFRIALCQVLQNDLSSSRLNVGKQFENLLQEPTKTANDPVLEAVVVVIDALDECKDDYGVRLIIGVLLQLGTNLPLKFFVTSRPEPAIRNTFLSPSACTPTVLRLHDIEQSIVEEDIKRYLVDEFSSLFPPPSSEQIDQLAKQSGKLFIYAATIVRYIQYSRGPVYPIARLNAILAKTPGNSNDGNASKKYEQLDNLYNTVLATAFDPEGVEQHELDTMQLILWTVVCAKEPMAISTLATFLSITVPQVESALQPLYSVLHVSESNGVVSVLHASFPDYMLEQSRSGRFSCNEANQSEFFAARCFDVMKKQLRFNLCGLESSFVPDANVPNLGQRIQTNISPALFYACRYWGEHLLRAGITNWPMLCDALAEFLSVRLLFWMEVLNLKKRLVDGISILDQAEMRLHSTIDAVYLKTQAADARDFVTRFAASPCVHITPHVYISALPLCAKSSSVYKCYWGIMKGLVILEGTTMSRRENTPQAMWTTATSGLHAISISTDGMCIATGSALGIVEIWDARTGENIAGPFEGHADAVNSVAFSPDHARIVSSSYDRTIRVRDTRTGVDAIDPLKGERAWFLSVVFSPDGARIASGSADGTIRVWDAHTGVSLASTFKGHKGSVYSVAFSPDGTRIVSGSSDGTIQLWDGGTGVSLASPFEGHTDWVHSVAFSPDGQRVVSGSYDRTVRVWGAHTGESVVGPLMGHTDWVNTVAFSPDGTLIASGSSDMMIRVWDALTGKSIVSPLRGHTGLVNTVAFSPDGTRLVSGSLDSTIRVWGARTKESVAAPPMGHTDWVNSVAFSADGTRIVSGSYDRTIRVWDAHTGVSLAGPIKGHTDSVNSVALSLDGTRIVSGSSDKTLRIWDACTGHSVVDPLKGHTDSVHSVALSPVGAHIVSGSDDKTIRVWDARTGKTVAGPFKGHTDSVRSVAFSPDGARIVSGSSDNTIRVWDAHTGESIVGPLQGHSNPVTSVGFSPDGTRIISGDFDGTIRVWDTRTGVAKSVASPLKGEKTWGLSVAFSPDGTRIVAASGHNTIRVLDVRSGDCVAGPFKGHKDSVKSVAFSPDGTHIVSGSSDHTIRVWDVHTRNQEICKRQSLPQDQGCVPDLAKCDWNVCASTGGWVMLNNLPAFWLPADIWALEPFCGATLVIGGSGSLTIDCSRVLLGNKWSECYTPQ